MASKGVGVRLGDGGKSVKFALLYRMNIRYRIRNYLRDSTEVTYLTLL